MLAEFQPPTHRSALATAMAPWQSSSNGSLSHRLTGYLTMNSPPWTADSGFPGHPFLTTNIVESFAYHVAVREKGPNRNALVVPPTRLEG